MCILCAIDHTIDQMEKDGHEPQAPTIAITYNQAEEYIDRVLHLCDPSREAVVKLRNALLEGEEGCRRIAPTFLYREVRVVPVDAFIQPGIHLDDDIASTRH